MDNKLYIIRGLPGSGKTTFARTDKRFNGCFHVEADMMHVIGGEYKFDSNRLRYAHGWCKKMVVDQLIIGMDVVVSNTFSRLWEVLPYLDLHSKENTIVYKVHKQFLYDSVHGVPQDVICNMKDRWEDIEGEIMV